MWPLGWMLDMPNMHKWPKEKHKPLASHYLEEINFNIYIWTELSEASVAFEQNAWYSEYAQMPNWPKEKHKALVSLYLACINETVGKNLRIVAQWWTLCLQKTLFKLNFGVFPRFLQGAFFSVPPWKKSVRLKFKGLALSNFQGGTVKKHPVDEITCDP